MEPGFLKPGNRVFAANEREPLYSPSMEPGFLKPGNPPPPPIIVPPSLMGLQWSRAS